MITFLIVAYSSTFSQNGESQKKQEQRIIEQQERLKAEEEQAKREMYEKHMAIQDKKTRKRMKKSKKKAKKINEHKGDFFLIRLFKNRKKGF
ncbi:MAG: hypothetical protein JKY53_08780 [Flavobacteriales bacterium]|nr:hypothetical protein [Flavobacteriales bacterium]